MIDHGVCVICNKFPARVDYGQFEDSQWICQLCWLEEEASERYGHRSNVDQIPTALENTARSYKFVNEEIQFVKRMFDAQNYLKFGRLHNDPALYLAFLKQHDSSHIAYSIIQNQTFHRGSFVAPKAWRSVLKG